MPRTFALLLLLVAPAAHAGWGKSIGPHNGPNLIDAVRPRLAEMLAAEGDERTRLIEEFASRHGEARIEAAKRFRNPELKELFLALLNQPDWRVKHRALLCLDDYGDPSILPEAWKLLRHSHRRMREKAALTCIRLWDGREPPGDLDALLRGENDLHVRRCLEALQRRIDGKLEARVVAPPHLEKGKDGLLMIPFLSGMDSVARVAPGYRKRVVSEPGKGSADRLPVADRWTYPLLGYGDEEVPGVSLQPFANLRGKGTVYHTGQDVGACLDGAGYYACADGVVKLIHAGSDMGTLVVVEHHLAEGESVTAVYMHGGTLFVEAGEQVTCGQLLATMGMGFSIENGGHFAHLHFGLYPGPFRANHNYGYRSVDQGLADWYDPARKLRDWVARTAPLVEDLRPAQGKLGRVVTSIEKGEFGTAYTQASSVQDGTEPGSEEYVDAVSLIGRLRSVPGRVIQRATRIRDAGYPADALDQLKTLAKRCKPIPDCERIAITASEWEDDALFAKALKGERRIRSAAKSAAKAKTPEKARAIWQKLLDRYGDTCLRPRIEERLR